MINKSWKETIYSKESRGMSIHADMWKQSKNVPTTDKHCVFHAVLSLHLKPLSMTDLFAGTWPAKPIKGPLWRNLCVWKSCFVGNCSVQTVFYKFLWDHLRRTMDLVAVCSETWS